MKNALPISLLILTLCLAVYAYLLHQNVQVTDELLDLQQRKSERLQNQVDSATNVIRAIQDSLEVANILYLAEKATSERAKKERLQIQKKYEQIRFTAFSNDSARVAALSKLFHSYGLPR